MTLEFAARYYNHAEATGKQVTMNDRQLDCLLANGGG